MDVDLSTGLEALPSLVTSIVDEGYEVAIGSRLSKGSQVVNRSLQTRSYFSGIQHLDSFIFSIDEI
ncbi:MAG: hypothetical protein Ct9H300mP19_19220 [Dehalococcoidia bacterium]|nr:MAG: hypothetical protein Ct9H300mP19_19220 [Dehalococcoidia bacterium]